MAKQDFCFTYYDGDAARDKAHMNRLERGAYDDIISAQRKRGHLSIDDLKRVLTSDFEKCWGAMEWVLEKDEEDKYFIEWVETSIEKMKRQSSAQSENGKKSAARKKELNHKENSTTVQPNFNQPINQNQPLEDGDGNEDVKDNSLKKSEKTFLVPAMKQIWMKKSPDYFSDDSKDCEPLQKISCYLAKTLEIPDNPTNQNLDDKNKIKLRWGELSDFILSEDFFKNYSLSQVEKHFQSILKREKNGTTKKPASIPGKTMVFDEW